MEKDTIIEKEQKAFKALRHIGFSKAEAQILIFLFKTGRVTSRDIEESTKLRQPEVSHGTNALINRKWIKTLKIITKGKGRPYYKYYLATSKKKIIDNIQGKIRKKIEHEQQNIIAVHELLL